MVGRNPAKKQPKMAKKNIFFQKSCFSLGLLILFRPKKGQKKLELAQSQAMGPAEMGGPIKLRFRADQHDFADFLHAFFPAQFLQENIAKLMQN